MSLVFVNFVNEEADPTQQDGLGGLRGYFRL